MAMASIGEAFSAASGFFGRGARLRTDLSPTAIEVDDEALDPRADGLAPGAPCFEAVAQALAEAGYLDG